MSEFNPANVLASLRPRVAEQVAKIAGTPDRSKWEPLHLRLAADEFEQGAGMKRPFPRHAKTLRRIAATMYVKRMRLSGAAS